MMSCVFEESTIDFDCLRQIITRVYSGNLDVTTFRMVLKQVDAGLAVYGMPVSTTSFSDPKNVVLELEALVPKESEVVASIGYVQIVMLLLELLSLLRKG